MLRIKQFEFQYRGSSFPVRIVADDDKKYVLKMKGAGNGARSLVQEFIVNKTAAILDFPVPDAQIIEIPTNYPWTFGTDEFDDIVQRSYGANLGIEYIDNTSVLSDMLTINSASIILDQIIALDFFFRNVDRTHQSQNFLIDAAGKIWLIDHGSCQFLTRQETAIGFQISQNHFASDDKLKDIHWLKRLVEFDFTPVLSDLSTDWLSEIELTRNEIYACLERRKQISRAYLSKSLGGAV